MGVERRILPVIRRHRNTKLYTRRAVRLRDLRATAKEIKIYECWELPPDDTAVNISGPGDGVDGLWGRRLLQVVTAFTYTLYRHYLRVMYTRT